MSYLQPMFVGGKTALVAGQKAVSCPKITADCLVLATANSVEPSKGELSIEISPGVGFTIHSTKSNDVSDVAYLIIY